MAKRMLIDATHPEETRVVVVNGTRLEQFDVETSTKKQLKGNIYLAKVVRVEPSLQAAFVDYGGNRHGFLAFSEIHPDYYQIPVADRQALLAEEAENGNGEEADEAEADEVETLGGDDAEDVAPRPRPRTTRNYKIQEVIKRRQIMLVQVVKEERGNKGAALTTYLSLAGRYCVLMPNTGKGGGVSRKITNAADRRRLKQIMQELDIAPSMAVILRTAGQSRSKAEVKRDYEYLMRTWNQIRETTLQSRAPCLIYEEANLIKRAIRDIYTSDIEEVLVEGEEGYRLAKDFMKLMTPSHAKKVQRYKDESMPLFHRYQVDSQLDAMHSPVVQLKSGGYVVINQTEALVAIDVNSGRATKERHIEETALKTNLEAAEEIARQLRLRDLAGLIVIDFIDMEEARNNSQVERRLKEALKQDRARIQMGRISHFGLLELSRQRLRPSLMETSFETCPHCGGSGMVRSVESASVHILRVIEEEGVRRRSSEVTVSVATPVALYILNNKRAALNEIESRYGFSVFLRGDDSLIPPDYRMERVKAQPQPGGEKETEVVEPATEAEKLSEEQATAEAGNGEGKKRRKRRKRRRRTEPAEVATEAQQIPEEAVETEPAGEADEVGEEGTREENAQTAEAEGEETGEGKRRRRSRRGGRRRRKAAEAEELSAEQAQGGEQAPSEPLPDAEAAVAMAEAPAGEPTPSGTDAVADAEEKPKRRRVRRKKAEPAEQSAAETPVAEETPLAAVEPEQATTETVTEGSAEDKPKRRRSRRKKAEEPAPEAAAVETETPQATDAAAEDKPKRRRTPRKKATSTQAAAVETAATEPPSAEAQPGEPTPEPAPEVSPEPSATPERAAPSTEAEPERQPTPEPALAEADGTQEGQHGPEAPVVKEPEVVEKEDGKRKPRRGWWMRLTS